MERRLSAILAADVAGYSRLMERDEERTHVAFLACRAAIAKIIADHRGRIFGGAGDSVMVEFASPVEAMRAGVEIQNRLADQPLDLPENLQMQFRIGINLGDVMVDNGELFGDGVNVAARLQALADPGGICISEGVHQHVESKLELAFDDLGVHQVKNIAKPVRMFRVLLSAPTTLTETATAQPPTKPSIAVLPFTNMSGDPEQEYFADGISEDIITELSRFTDLFVIARNSCFTFKGQAVDVKAAGRKLGARFVVEGSVRKAGSRVRVTAQLVDTGTGNHLWAERYDRSLDDIFAVQDDLVNAISGAIPGQLNRLAVEDLRRKTPSNVTAYDCELRGRWALNHWREGLPIALEWFEKAIKADPDYALAHAGIANAYSYGLYALGLPPETALARAKEHAHRAIVLDDRNPTINALAASTYQLAGEYKLARKYAERAVALNPKDPFVLSIQASTLLHAGGEPKQALEWMEKSERIEAYTHDDYRLDILEDCYYMLREYEKVIEMHELYQLPAFLKLVLAAAFAQTGQFEKAKAAVEEYERTRPSGHDATTMIEYQMRMLARQEDRNLWLEGYRRAGLPV
jgi:adenylate cyclase